jgi:hypothetical protein
MTPSTEEEKARLAELNYYQQQYKKLDIFTELRTVDKSRELLAQHKLVQACEQRDALREAMLLVNGGAHHSIDAGGFVISEEVMDVVVEALAQSED